MLKSLDQVMDWINNTDIKYPHKTINELFEEQVLKTPDYIAAKHENNSVTYMELYKKVNKASRALSAIGVTRGSIVAIMMKRSINIIVWILAILKTGSAYLPIDPNYPEERILYMLNDSNTSVLLTQLCFKDKVRTEKTQFVEELETSVLNEIIDNREICKLNDLAYVIYTSGTTGIPKGVMIEHKNVANFIKGITSIIDFSQGKKIIWLTTVSFDISVLETLLSLCKGLTIVIANENQQRNPVLLKNLIIKNNIDMLQITPSRIQLLMSYDSNIHFLNGIKEIMIGGENFPDALLEKLRCFTNAKIYNMYGPTETTVWSTVSDVTLKKSVDIGRPIANTRVYIIDEHNNQRPIGAEGELCISGEGLTRGYINNSELTEKKIILNKFNLGERIYKTGDIAVLLSDCNIKYLGRKDKQIKIRGYRIELGEIECNILRYQNICQTCVTSYDREDSSKYLCAYFTSNVKIDVDSLYDFISKILPKYMIPSYFIQLEYLPETPNGKIDKSKLPNPEIYNKGTKETNKAYVNCKIVNNLEKIVYEVLNKSLTGNEINNDAELIGLGIDSISFIKIVVIIEERFQIKFDIDDLDFDKFPLFKDLVHYVSIKIVC